MYAIVYAETDETSRSRSRSRYIFSPVFHQLFGHFGVQIAQLEMKLTVHECIYSHEKY